MPESDHDVLIHISADVKHLSSAFEVMNKQLFGNGSRGCIVNFERRIGKLEAIRPYFGSLIGFGLMVGGGAVVVLGRLVLRWLEK